MPTIPLPEDPEPDSRAEQARAVVKSAARSLGATDRRSFTTIAALMLLAVCGVSNPQPYEAAIAAVCAVIVALTMDGGRR